MENDVRMDGSKDVEFEHEVNEDGVLEIDIDADDKGEKLSMVASHTDGHHWVDEFFLEDPESLGKKVLSKLRDKRVTEVSIATQGLRPLDEDTRG